MLTYLNLGNNGRLGNQLFQIAATIGIAMKNDEQYIFKPYGYNKFFKKEIPTGEIIVSKQYNEPFFHYSDVVAKDCNLHGYFQSEKYFKHCEDLIREYFSLKPDFETHLKNKY